jgi:hypothetical protein
MQPSSGTQLLLHVYTAIVSLHMMWRDQQSAGIRRQSKHCMGIEQHAS